MKLFGNHNRRKSNISTGNTRKNEAVRHEENCSPRRAIILFCAALCVFIVVVVMCLLLIRKSGEQNIQITEPSINALEYEVNGQNTQPTESTQEPLVLEVPEGVNDSDILNILLLSPNEDALRTDTIMLLNLELNTGDVSLLSLPRDTYISGNYELPKLHQVYHQADGGKKGAKALLEKVKEMIGFWPDYYLVLDAQVMTFLVDQVGGKLEFSIPEDADYSALSSGKQTLNSSSAIDVLKYRDDYTEIETDSTGVQRDFLLNLLEKYSKSVENIAEVAALLAQMLETDLKEKDIVYLINFLKKVNWNDVYSNCFTGKAIKDKGDTFFQVDIKEAVELLNDHFNPTDEKLDIYDVNFRQETGDSGDGQYSDFGFKPTQKPTESTEPSEDTPDDSSEASSEPESSEPESSETPPESSTEAPTDPPTESSETP